MRNPGRYWARPRQAARDQPELEGEILGCPRLQGSRSEQQARLVEERDATGDDDQDCDERERPSGKIIPRGIMFPSIMPRRLGVEASRRPSARIPNGQIVMSRQGFPPGMASAITSPLELGSVQIVHFTALTELAL